ncbi:MAG: 50S ribosomal protein L4 [Bryobacteraceae bacterium]|nr:50S ribosomal protein L4 [Bryobacteraceae bacterium]
MPVVDVVDLSNNKVGELELADTVFAAPVNEALLYEAVRNFRANHRGGTVKTKTRAEVSGSGKKLWRQKGTGRARMGSVRSPIWRKGGTVHGPRPRDYSYRLPRKMLLGALRSALTVKLQDGGLTVVSAFDLADHKTRTMQAVLNVFEARRKVLLVDNPSDNKLDLGSRNLPGVTLLATREVTAYDLLDHEKILMSEAAAKKLSEALAI